MVADKDLLKAILSLETQKDLNDFFKELFTPAELEGVSLRWKLLKDLYKGDTQRKIASRYGISLCKITRGSKLLKNQDSLILKILQTSGETD